jgi:hypothetical protein
MDDMPVFAYILDNDDPLHRLKTGFEVFQTTM